VNLSVIYSRTNDGIEAPQVTVEVHLSNGLPGFSIVGLAELAVKESKDRVRAAIINSNFEFPAKRITVNLAPADIPKDGGRFDLPIALGILAASGQISADKLDQYEFIGELSLGGQLRPVKGVLPTAFSVNQAKRKLFVPLDNANEASLINTLPVYAANHLLQICNHLADIEKLSVFSKAAEKREPSYSVDIQEVKGQFQAKRALEIAAAGNHHLMMIGPPGTGKTSVILKSAVQYLAKNTTQNILLLAYTNRAVDEICGAIESDMPEMKDLYFRIGNINSTHERFRDQLLSEKIKNLNNRKDVKAKIQEHRIVVSTISSIINKPEIFQFMKFETTLIDEASQILEPQLIGILSRVKRFILIGDHRQLPAVVAQKKIFSQKEDKLLATIGIHDLANSYFERLFMRCRKNKWDWAYGMLSMQGRMHKDVMAFANTHFYDQKLQILPKGLNPRQSDSDYLHTNSSDKLQKAIAHKRMIFLDTPVDDTIGSGKKNPHEAQKIVEILQHIKAIYQENNKTLTKDSIGIITPYRAQIAQIRETIFQQDPDWLNFLTIDTVERYQGGARDIIIISVCLNKPYQLQTLVALSNENIDRKLNVALTRARDQIIMVGNKALLQQDERYGAFIESYFLE